MTHRSHQHGEILHAPGQDGADQQPKEARRKPELRRQSRPHQRSGAGDGREVMSEEHPSWRSDIVMPVGVRCAGSRAAIVERQSLRGNERAVVTVGKAYTHSAPSKTGKVFIRLAPDPAGSGILLVRSSASYTHRGIRHNTLP
jgi:hypothetical protein